ncbi:MAG: Crp/Fnr family transcriptional regulator [candidate division KSB1 bacterium]|nr:Crp/Fnr family transcriptional regulator [candidate division KSB1 bacterium]MDZ7318490.1 Crp/Fnr family transcriptional regulator [candidate division KSB1 bacterium]MDZ7340609.1 Crp/Fnr family transcriptional regulator [candidate division KSB1 bacterium]
MDIQSILSHTFLFESLSNEQLELISGSASVKKIAKGEHLFLEEQPATAFFLIISGSVKLYKLAPDGSEQILHVQQPGDLVAEAIIFEFKTYPAFCQALENTELIRFSKTEFLDLLQHFPEITFKMMAAYSRRLRQLVAKIEELALHDVKARLANFLITNATYDNNRWSTHLAMSKRDLAAMLGTIPETLSRTLNYFRRERLITEDKNEIVLLNKEKLKAIGES